MSRLYCCCGVKPNGICWGIFGREILPGAPRLGLGTAGCSAGAVGCVTPAHTSHLFLITSSQKILRLILNHQRFWSHGTALLFYLSPQLRVDLLKLPRSHLAGQSRHRDRCDRVLTTNTRNAGERYQSEEFHIKAQSA